MSIYSREKEERRRKAFNQTTQQVETSQPTSGLCSDLNMMRTSRPPSLTAEICPPHTDACLPPFMHLQRTETQPAVLSLTRVPTCSSVLWWLAENSRGHYGCHVRPVLKMRSQFIGSRGYRWSTDRLVKQPAHLYTHVTQTRVLDS